MPKSVQKRLDEGRAVYDLGEGPKDPETAAEARGTPNPPDRPASDGMPVPARCPQSMGPAPSGALDDQKLEDLEEYYDDVSGETLPLASPGRRGWRRSASCRTGTSGRSGP